ncbi:uncharacterized protein LOC135486316 [Lineus longissimus]|uniref:uncharacterized protein LOC135486316 n=1 Tax=Lineus longissimus TaxID=88925 RepID=UPI002B4DBD1C
MSIEIIDVDGPEGEKVDDISARLIKWKKSVDAPTLLSLEENLQLKTFLEEIVNCLNASELLDEIPPYLPKFAALLHALSPIPREKVCFDIGLLHEPILRCFVTLSQLSLNKPQVKRIKKWATCSLRKLCLSYEGRPQPLLAGSIGFTSDRVDEALQNSYLVHLRTEQPEHEKLNPALIPNLSEVIRLDLDCGNSTAIEPVLKLLKCYPGTKESEQVFKMITQEIYDRGGKNILTADGAEILWKNHTPSLEREVLRIAAAWRNQCQKPTERMQVIKSSFLPEVSARNHDIYVTLMSILQTLVLKTHCHSETVHLLASVHACIREFLDTHKCAKSTLALYPLKWQPLANFLTIDLGALAISMQCQIIVATCQILESYCLDVLTCEDARLLALQHHRFYSQLIRLLLHVPAKNLPDCLKVLSWFICAHRRQRMAADEKDALQKFSTELRVLRSKSHLQIGDVEFAMLSIQGQENIQEIVKMLLVFFLVSSKGSQKCTRAILSLICESQSEEDRQRFLLEMSRIFVFDMNAYFFCQRILENNFD